MMSKVLLCVCLLQAQLDALELTTGPQAGVKMHSPRASLWAGPTRFRMNTTETNSDLVFGGQLSQFCSLTREVRERSSAVQSLQGKTVLLSHKGILVSTCVPHEAYLNLVDIVGVRAVIIFNMAVQGEPGYLAYAREYNESSLFEAKEKAVPFLEVSQVMGVTLKRLTLEPSPPLHMILTPDTNAWIGWSSNWGNVFLLQLLVPFGYFCVAVVAKVVASSGFTWGSTKCWLVFVEGVPAVILGECTFHYFAGIVRVLFVSLLYIYIYLGSEKYCELAIFEAGIALCIDTQHRP